jgi:arylsulfatase A-like enzyme
MSLPPTVRPAGAPAPAEFHPAEAFTLDKRTKQAAVWKTPLPMHSNLLPMREKGTHIFGNYAPPGLMVSGPDGELAQNRFVKQAGQYAFDRDFLYVGTPPEADAPDPSQIALRFDKATRMEDALNLATSGRDPVGFALRELVVDASAHTGVLLPPPGQVSWTVALPAGAKLAGRVTVVEPAIREAVRSDGATLVVEITPPGGAAVEVGRVAAQPGAWADLSVDLATWGGQSVALAIRSEGGGSMDLDYLFVEEPTVYTPSATPERVVLVFVDTLRRDHLGFYGYARPTTPKLDPWAAQATVFDAARTVAPWTLPSARALLTGAQPERWFETPTLPARLAEAGFQTEAIVTNAFLSQTFDMHRGWSRFDYDHEAPASQVVTEALARLSAHPDRDLAVMIHLMEPHIPYDEPEPYRTLFAGAQPAALQEPVRRELLKVNPMVPEFEAIRDYVVARYDQNIRVVDDEVARLLDAVGPNATVVFFSDHGEEFWDHGFFEHGHGFGDELLRVPLAIRSPHLPAGRVAAPVSLLDVTPTVLDLLGLPSAVPHGQSLVHVAWQDAGAAEALAARPQAFGRPLYGLDGQPPSVDGWGVVADGHKWAQRGGRQSLFDLSADPAEGKNLLPGADAARYPAALAEALGVEVVPVWRMSLFNARGLTKSELTVTVPGGFAAAWNTYDPRGEYEASTPQVQPDGSVRLVQAPDGLLPPALYLRPVGDPRRVVGLTSRLASGAMVLGGQVFAEGERQEPLPTGMQAATAPAVVEISPTGAPVLSFGDAAFGATVELVWVALPTGVAVSGFAPEMRQQLLELGYLQE